MLPFEIHFRSAVLSDLAAIMALFEEAKTLMRQQGLEQWQDSYPEEEILRQDITDDCGYVLTHDGEVAGYFAFSTAHEPAYDFVENGSFREEGKAGVVHRVVVSKSVRGHGLGRRIFDYAIKLAHIELCVTVRCDTHENNRAMRGLLAKCGFTSCGVVYYQRNGASVKRVVYDILI